MVPFCINPLSANRQCFSLAHAETIVRNLVQCCDYLLPALDRNRVRLFYDSRIEQRQLVREENLHASINGLRGGEDPDLARRWYLYTKNRAEEIENEGFIVDIAATGTDETVSGEINPHLFRSCLHWLSLGGSDLNESPELRITTVAEPQVDVKNAHDLHSVRVLLPRYEPSTKHRAESYWAGAEFVSAMPLTVEDAQRLLLSSLEHENDRWAFHEIRQKCYCFKATRVDQQIYHGYEVDDADIPNPIREELRRVGFRG